MEAIVLRSKKAYFNLFFSRCRADLTHKEVWIQMEDEINKAFGIGVYDEYDTFIKAKNRYVATIGKS